MNIKVSIIIPVYKVAPYLDACLSSCVNQTFREIEIIVVNDGSPDTSYQIIATYAATDERIVVINKENEGVIYARKSGLEIARGEYVFYLDGDDYLETDAIALLYKEAVETNSDYVIGGDYLVIGNTRIEQCAGKEAIGLSGQDLLLFLLNKPKWSLCERLIRKDLFDHIVYKAISMGEDLYINMQIVLKVKNASVVDAGIYNYLQHDSSAMAKSFEETLKPTLHMIVSIWSLLDAYSYDQRIKKKIYCLFFRFFIGAVKRNKTEVKSILRTYYWNRKEVRSYLWQEKKIFYLLCAGYLYIPWIATFVVKCCLNVVVLFKGDRYDL